MLKIRPSSGLEKNDSINIFTFGDTGAGKSTFLATLIDYFVKSEECLFVFDHDNKVPRELILQWLDRIKELKFPPISRTKEIIDLQIGLVGMNSDFKIKFVLYEMSGEDLRKISTKHGGDLEREWQQALDRSDVILSFVPRNEVFEKELFLGEFFNFLYNKRVQKPVAIIVTKWDLVTDNTSEIKGGNRENTSLLENLVKTGLSWPLKFLKIQGIFENPAVFYFTVGEVDKDRIVKISPRGLEEIAGWILENSVHQI